MRRATAASQRGGEPRRHGLGFDAADLLGAALHTHKFRSPHPSRAHRMPRTQLRGMWGGEREGGVGSVNVSGVVGT